MGISNLFNSYPGMYIVQSVCHSLIAAIIVDRSIQIFRVGDPFGKQRLRYIVIVFPIFSFPLYQVINNERGTIAFRLETLFDANRWLNLELWNGITLGLFFVLVLSVTVLVSLFQEMIPVIKHTLEARKAEADWQRPGSDSPVWRVLDNLSAERPDVFIMDDDDFILFSTTGKNAAIFISTGVINALNLEQLKAAIAHEIAHIRRTRRPVILMLFFLRLLMFYNPITLIEFRKIIQEDEQACDNIAVSMTGNPSALAETLRKLYHVEESLKPLDVIKPSRFRASVEDYSHSMVINTRIKRLESLPIVNEDSQWFRFAAVLIVIMVLNYFIV